MSSFRFCRLVSCITLASCASSRAPLGQDGRPASVSAALDADTERQRAERSTPADGRRLARIRVAYEAVDAAAAEWNLTSFGQDCVLTFAPAEEWAVGCPDLSKDPAFQRTGEQFAGVDVLWSPESIRLAERNLPFSDFKLLVGTVLPYPSANGSVPVLIIQDWEPLRAGHPAFKDSHLDEWIGIFVHEAFHARQLWHHRLRGMLAAKDSVPQDENLASYYTRKNVGPAELSAYYTSHPEFRAALEREYAVLRRVDDAPELGAEDARAVLARWLELYEARARKMNEALGNELAAEADAYLTFVEGTARYVEARTLQRPPASADVLLANEPTFEHFRRSRGKAPSQLDGIGGLSNTYYYAIGMFVAFVLDRADPRWKAHVFDTDGLLVDAVRRSVRGSTSASSRSDE